MAQPKTIMNNDSGGGRKRRVSCSAQSTGSLLSSAHIDGIMGKLKDELLAFEREEFALLVRRSIIEYCEENKLL